MPRRLLPLLLLLATPRFGVAADTIRFLREGVEVKQATVAEIVAACAVATVEVADPHAAARRRYRACPIADVFTFAYGAAPAALGTADVFVRTWTGEDRTIPAAQLTGSHLAVGDAEGDMLHWTPLGPKKLDPGPLYLVWTSPPARAPWPMQIVELEVEDFAGKYPHVMPTSAPRSSPAWHGFEIFRGECIACHAINREGGHTGPDLNVPQSVVEYRPEAQIKAYIKNPRTFRYGNMPAHEDLTPGDLDAIVAYFRVMKRQKHDPGAGRP